MSDSVTHGLQTARLLCSWISQARILEWIAISSSRGSSQSRDQTSVCHIAGGLFTIWATGEASTWVYFWLVNSGIKTCIFVLYLILRMSVYIKSTNLKQFLFIKDYLRSCKFKKHLLVTLFLRVYLTYKYLSFLEIN